ncbi:MAG: DUF2474 domain-containing protein [Acetobacter sp.]
MVITDMIGGNGDRAPKRMSVRLIWFVLIWALSTAAFFILASCLHFLVPK